MPDDELARLRAEDYAYWVELVGEEEAKVIVAETERWAIELLERVSAELREKAKRQLN